MIKILEEANTNKPNSVIPIPVKENTNERENKSNSIIPIPVKESTNERENIFVMNPKDIPKKINVGYLKKLAKQNMYVEYIAKKPEKKKYNNYISELLTYTIK